METSEVLQNFEAYYIKFDLPLNKVDFESKVSTIPNVYVIDWWSQLDVDTNTYTFIMYVIMPGSCPLGKILGVPVYMKRLKSREAKTTESSTQVYFRGALKSDINNLWILYKKVEALDIFPHSELTFKKNIAYLKFPQDPYNMLPAFVSILKYCPPVQPLK